jgi:hypothetical protein
LCAREMPPPEITRSPIRIGSRQEERIVWKNLTTTSWWV